MFRPRPTHHASAQLRSQRSAIRAPSAQSTRCRSRPPRGVTVFAEREDKPGASNPQKQRRHFTPSHRLWVRSSQSRVSTAHAPSRRLQRVSESCTRISRGQPPRRRPQLHATFRVALQRVEPASTSATSCHDRYVVPVQSRRALTMSSDRRSHDRPHSTTLHDRIAEAPARPGSRCFSAARVARR